MNMDQITLYGLKICNSDGTTSRIRAIKALRCIATLQGATLSLKSGKYLVENIEHNPIVVDCEPRERPILLLALSQWFNTNPPQTPLPTRLGRFYDYPECPDIRSTLGTPMPMAIDGEGFN